MFSRGHSMARAKLAEQLELTRPPILPRTGPGQSSHSLVLQVLREGATKQRHVPLSSVTLGEAGRVLPEPRARSSWPPRGGSTKRDKPEALRQLLMTVRGCQTARWEKCPI